MGASQPSVYTCTYSCGWKREYRTELKLQRRIIEHPIYGVLPNQRIVELDIKNHVCQEYLLARDRARRAVARYYARLAA